MAQFGLTAAGFVPMQLQDVKADLEDALKDEFGNNINLGSEAIFGQIVGVFSERFALLWQLGEAIYSSQYPNGAEGISVDNILALNNLKRLPASPTKTNTQPLTDDTTELTKYGLVLFGTPGTNITPGSIIKTSGSPALSFSLDNPVTIGAAVNAIQSIFFSNTPNQGAFTLRFTDPDGNLISTPSILWNAQDAISEIKFSAAPVTGNMQIGLTAAGQLLTTANIPFGANAGAVQSAINALTGYGGVTVTGTFAGGFVITWGSICNPIMSFPVNTFGVTITPIDSVQAAVNNLQDPNSMLYPYTDVIVTALSPGFALNFGLSTPVAPNLSSGGQQQAITQVQANTLQNGSTVTNIAIINTRIGNPAQGIGSATCTVNGPNFVAASTLTVIGSPVSGWTGVDNQLDAIEGTNIEDDTAALSRRSALLNAQANGPLNAIVEKVLKVIGVTAAIGFENLNEAALQQVTISGSASSGTFQLAVGLALSAAIPYNATAAQVQTALRTIPGFGTTNVTGSLQDGFTVDFNGTNGGQDQPLMTVQNNSTGLTITLAFGRPGKSFEIVAQGGDDLAIATVIFNSKPAGIETYGTTTVTVQDVFGNPYAISFSRPTQVPIFITINLTTDLQTAAQPKFTPASIQTIQEDLITIGNMVGIGGLIIGFGTEGLIGAFNDVPGIIEYTMSFDKSPSPSTNTNIQMLPEQVPLFETFNIIVSYT